jgi:hypothetical protein
MVEVFTTNVDKQDQSKTLVQRLLAHFPKSRINFDLDDCDRILRVEGDNILPLKIIELINLHGYECKILEG